MKNKLTIYTMKPEKQHRDGLRQRNVRPNNTLLRILTSGLKANFAA